MPRSPPGPIQDFTRQSLGFRARMIPTKRSRLEPIPIRARLGRTARPKGGGHDYAFRTRRNSSSSVPVARHHPVRLKPPMKLLRPPVFPKYASFASAKSKDKSSWIETMGAGYEPGITNLPIVENSKLKTGEGVAEIEFEDNSSLRVAPDSIVEFPQLERMATGGTASTVHLVQGMAYVSLMKSGNNQFNLTFGGPEPRPSIAQPHPAAVEWDRGEAGGAGRQPARGRRVRRGPGREQEKDGHLRPAAAPAADGGQGHPARALRRMGPDIVGISCPGGEYERLQRVALFVRPERHGLLRELREWLRRGLDVASLLCQRGVGSLLERRLGLLPGRGLFVGLAVSVGLDSLPYRLLELSAPAWGGDGSRAAVGMA